MKCKNCQSELTRGKKGYICEECDSRYSFEEIESENTQSWEKEVIEGLSHHDRHSFSGDAPLG